MASSSAVLKSNKLPECCKGAARTIVRVHDSHGVTVELSCGHYLEWPEGAFTPKAGQVTHCHQEGCCPACCLKPVVRNLAVYKRRKAEWACIEDQTDIVGPRR